MIPVMNGIEGIALEKEGNSGENGEEKIMGDTVGRDR